MQIFKYYFIFRVFYQIMWSFLCDQDFIFLERIHFNSVEVMCAMKGPRPNDTVLP